MKKFLVKSLLLWLVVSLLGCAAVQSIVTTGCAWMDEYVPKADAAVVKIQADYDTYADIVSGIIPVSPAILAQAKAWIAAADISLRTLGAVQQKVCSELADILLALETAKNSLPQLAIPEKTLRGIRVQ